MCKAYFEPFKRGSHSLRETEKKQTGMLSQLVTAALHYTVRPNIACSDDD